MPNLQTQTAIDTLSELYGKPSWLKTPKQGQNLEKVFAEWDAELKKYSEEQIKVVCRKMYKYRRTATFPSLAHILAELVDVEPEPEENPVTITGRSGYMEAFADFRDKCVTNGFNGRICYSSDVDKALYMVCDEINAEYPPENHWDVRTTSELVNLAIINGVFWEKLHAFLAGIVAKIVPYVPSGSTGFSSVPPEFTPNNARRKCV